MRFFRKIAYVFVLLCFTTVAAQSATEDATCSVMVQQAMSAVQQDCASTGRNQACYGYVSLQATPRQDVQNFSFSKEGDLANVADLSTLRLSALDTANQTWGIALMKLQANLPDTLPGQNVTFLLFGDVQIQNAVTPGEQLATIGVSSNGSVNIRSTPSTNGSIIGTLARGDTMTANGRNADGSWLRIQLPGSNSLGWVFANLVTPDGDAKSLSVVDASQTDVPYTPMQAFYFKTGVTQTSCEQAPQDGILIQTPQGVGQISLRANDVDIQLGSTAFLQAQPNANMTVSVVEGEGHVTANGKTVDVPAGSQVTIPVNQDLQASDVPSDPQPYDPALVNPLPVQLLPQQITIAPPASAALLGVASGTQVPGNLGGGGVAANLPPGFNPAALSGMSQAQFCAYMNIAFAQTGLNKDQYLAQIQQVAAFVPADSKAEFDQLIQMIGACP